MSDFTGCCAPGWNLLGGGGHWDPKPLPSPCYSSVKEPKGRVPCVLSRLGWELVRLVPVETPQQLRKILMTVPAMEPELSADNRASEVRTERLH